MSTPSLDRVRKLPPTGLRSPPTMAMLPAHARGLLEAPLDDCVRVVVCVVHAGLRVLSLLVKGICLPLEVWQESWPNFKGLPKVSEVATNHWVFLRCDWSLVFN